MVQGYLDSCDDGVVAGWAARPGAAERVILEIFVDGQAVGRATAALFREDLRAAGIGDGKHGFEFTIPDDVRKRGRYAVSVRDMGSQQELTQSPLLVVDDDAHVLTGRRFRRFIASQYFSGEGLEIGPLHRPMPVPPGVRVTYTDSFARDVLKTLWSPEVEGHDLAPVDIVTDATTLEGIADQSFDFVVASHVLEHLEDPVRGFLNALRVLRRQGVLFLALPDRRFTFDSRRPPTTVDHVVRDYRRGAARSRRDHYKEWVRLVEGLTGQDAWKRVTELESTRYPIHFHVWSGLEFTSLLHALSEAIPIHFSVELFKAHGPEGVWVIRRSG